MKGLRSTLLGTSFLPPNDNQMRRNRVYKSLRNYTDLIVKEAMNRILLICIALLAAVSAGYAQPRPVDTASKTTATPAPVAAAPESFEAKYEGGMFGYTKKEEGTLKFDDANERLVFFDKNKTERFHIPYKSVLVIYPQSRSVTSTAGNVVSHIPLPGSFLGGFMKEKRRYIILHFDDPDVAARGVVNFKLENKELLDSVMHSLAGKSQLVQRGDAFYRPRKAGKNEI